MPGPPVLSFGRWTLCQFLKNLIKFALMPFFVQDASTREWKLAAKDSVKPGCRSNGKLDPYWNWLNEAEAFAEKARPCLRNYTLEGQQYGKNKCKDGWCSTVPNPAWDDETSWRQCTCKDYEVWPWHAMWCSVSCIYSSQKGL